MYDPFISWLSFLRIKCFCQRNHSRLGGSIWPSSSAGRELELGSRRRSAFTAQYQSARPSYLTGARGARRMAGRVGRGLVLGAGSGDILECRVGRRWRTKR